MPHIVRPCEHCQGKGIVPGPNSPHPCPYCRGSTVLSIRQGQLSTSNLTEDSKKAAEALSGKVRQQKDS